MIAEIMVNKWLTDLFLRPKILAVQRPKPEISFHKNYL